VNTLLHQYKENLFEYDFWDQDGVLGKVSQDWYQTYCLVYTLLSKIHNLIDIDTVMQLRFQRKQKNIHNDENRFKWLDVPFDLSQ
jgi:hypothetical protein